MLIFLVIYLLLGLFLTYQIRPKDNLDLPKILVLTIASPIIPVFFILSFFSNRMRGK